MHIVTVKLEASISNHPFIFTTRAVGIIFILKRCGIGIASVTAYNDRPSPSLMPTHVVGFHRYSSCKRVDAFLFTMTDAMRRLLCHRVRQDFCIVLVTVVDRSSCDFRPETHVTFIAFLYEQVLSAVVIFNASSHDPLS